MRVYIETKFKPLIKTSLKTSIANKVKLLDLTDRNEK